MTLTSIPARPTELGSQSQVLRGLPQRGRRTLGAWCFLDHFGPVPMTGGAMAVGPHPHIGLQTVTWLVDGELLHLDSVGSRQPIRRGQLNLMTSGSGITHAEISPVEGPSPSATLHGLQLWIALPASAHAVPPAFEHHPQLPTREVGGWTATVVLGDLLGERSPATTYSPLVGADLVGSGPVELELRGGFEHGVYVIDGEVVVTEGAGDGRGDGRGDVVRATRGEMVVADVGAARLHIEAAERARVFLLGGEPYTDPLHMWWNFVAPTRADIDAATEEWNRDTGASGRFGEVRGSGLPREPAPLPPWVASS